MNIDGLDYNTQRAKLILPEYGREIQQMVDHCLTLTDREERQRCAETIIAVMDRMFPENRGVEDHEQKLWDQLAIMSNFQLDIDFPYDVSDAVKIATKPEPLPYPMQHIPVRHYGAMLFEIFEKLKTMEPSEERDKLVELTANQMHRDLVTWSHGSSDVAKVASDLARFTDGNIQLDLDTFVFEKIEAQPKNVNNNKNSANSERAKKLQEKKEANDKKIQELREAAAANGKAVKPGSLADKVGMVSRYNEVNDKRK